ncbi:hypothetical protein [Bdellovibrio sp. BCCA]|uniref:hypothetical protein n=1 Tax=Bdellovibrio sp. BCCA TaxID=3136281 RepID=UPI0030F2860D
MAAFDCECLKNLDNNERLVVLFLIVVPQPNIDAVIKMGLSDRLFTSTLKSLKLKGLIEKVKGFEYLGKRTWSPILKVKYAPNYDETRRYISLEVLFNRNLTPLARVLHAYLNNGQPRVEFFSKTIETTLDIPRNTVNLNLERLNEEGVVEIVRKEGTQSRVIIFEKVEKRHILSSIFGGQKGA